MLKNILLIKLKQKLILQKHNSVDLLCVFIYTDDPDQPDKTKIIDLTIQN